MNFDKVTHKCILGLGSLFVRLMPGIDNMLFAGQDSSRHLCLHIARSGLRRVQVVTDKPLVDLGIVEQAIRALTEQGIETVVFDQVLPDPTFQIVHDGLASYRQNNCDCILAIGGGSAIDSAKIIALAATNPQDPSSFVGYNKARQKPVPFFAIATTSGTGSEATLGAVISNSITHEKAIISDRKLLPLAVALDPLLLTGLPPHITAATGMDALTHAIEATIGVWDYGDSQNQARLATRLIFQHLPIACENGADLASREAMAYAAYCAGQAINKTNVGNVHAIAHQLGQRYGIPHGLANAVALPYVLDYCLAAAGPRLAELARLLQLGEADDSERQLAARFVEAVRHLNRRIGIPEVLEQIKVEDIPSLTDAAVKESIAYPVPCLMSREDCSRILQQMVAK
jgi:alcohol dehydrogenase class IV